MERKIIKAYTDGSAVVVGPKKGNGGFGTYFPDLFGSKQGFSAGFENTKTGRMEVMALYYAIVPFEVDKNIHLKVYSDSQYVVKTFTEKRLEKWIRGNWISNGAQIKNVDLWIKVKEALDNRPNLKLELIHIKSHQVEKEKNPVAKAYLLLDPNIVGNMMADILADYKRHSTIHKLDIII